MDEEKKPTRNLLCCFSCTPKVTPVILPPIVMSKPYAFSTPPRPGYKKAPEPPKDKGPSIIYEKQFTNKDIPAGFYFSDLSGNASYAD